MEDQSASDSWEAAPYRDRFVIDEDLIYLDGNSLGRLPKAAALRMADVITEQWGRRLIRGWNDGWLDLPGRIGDKIGQLVGAAPGQIHVGDSTSVQLFKLARAAIDAQPTRRRIVTQRANFPTDRYLVDRIASDRSPAMEVVTLSEDADPDRAPEIDHTTALLLLSHVDYRSGRRWDMERWTQRAHQAGALVLWDVSHSVGALPMELDRWEVDLVAGCSYKYLNGGPGAPAFLYVRRALHHRLFNPIAGWFSAARPFEFAEEYEPSESIDRFAAGTPPVLALAAMEAGIDLAIEAGIEATAERSRRLTEYLIEQFDRRLASRGFSLATPRPWSQRGSHISLAHPRAWGIVRCLIERYGVLPDFRPPNLLRLGVSGLYTSRQEIDAMLDGCVQIIDLGLDQDSQPPTDAVP